MPDFVTVDTGGATLNVAVVGDPQAPMVMCLHGFPEYWAAWREVMDDLSRDHFVVVPDQRGYHRSSRPADVAAVKGRPLVEDIAAVADHFSPGKPFALAGHDWGASIAYAFAFAHPDRLTSLTIANGVHPICFQRAIFDDPPQRRASQYINTLRAPEADTRMVEDDFRRTFRMIEGFSDCGWMTPEMRAGYLNAWSQPGAMRAMLNWYRASPIIVPEVDAVVPDSPMLRRDPADFMVRVRHLLIWGDEDEALRPSCYAGLEAFAPDLTVTHLAGTGHWLLHERPAEVASAIRSFVG